MIRHRDMHARPVEFPLAYFITMRTYGTWLHGDDRGSVSRAQNRYGSELMAPNANRLSDVEMRMKDKQMLLAAESAAMIERTVTEVCTHRRWNLRAVHARSNHVHVVVGATLSPERVMNDFKAWGTRRLRENGYLGADETAWAEHGSTPYLWTDAQLAGAIDYVKNWQGGRLQKTWDQVRQEIDERERRKREGMK